MNSCVTWILLVFLFTHPILVLGQDHQAEQKQSKERITQIIESEEFHQIKTVRDLEFLIDWLKNFSLDDSDTEEFGTSQILLLIISWVAKGIEVILWSSLMFLVFVLVYKYRNQLYSLLHLQNNVQETTFQSETLFGLEVGEASLPDNIRTNAERLWDQNKKRDAMSLLYRASLSKLVSNFNIDLHSGNTELECVHMAAKELSTEISKFFYRLTQNWLVMAYGHQVPKRDTFFELTQLWEHYFNALEKV